MGRLIDADEMTKRLQEWNRNDDIDKALYNFAMHRIIEQPTAFDVEAVVEELEAQKMLAKINFTDFNERFDIGTYQAFEEAIEIVRKGGVK